VQAKALSVSAQCLCSEFDFRRLFPRHVPNVGGAVRDAEQESKGSEQQKKTAMDKAFSDILQFATQNPSS
jgi:hypothetical protein